MGRKDVVRVGDPELLREFTARLLEDVRELERMLEEGRIESGPRRIGAELELFLVDRDWRPAPIGPLVRERAGDPRVTSELGAFNLEINSDPFPLGGDCLRDLERHLADLLGTVRAAALDADAEVVLAGILPTLLPSDLSLENMTPEDRYHALNDSLNRLRGDKYRIFIKGVDELLVEHDTVMLEACNTSFQLHLQVDPGEFARLYNLGLLALAPLVAASTNSPLLFGRRLWRETRIALFQQSIDTRRTVPDMRRVEPRVHFGHGWIENSVLEVFKDDIARFRVLLASHLEERRKTSERAVPRLPALQLFNSTVYRWLRPCYGASSDTAHLRIENRVLPSGPSLPDQMANAALWYGLLKGLSDEVGDDVRRRIGFDDVKGNFLAAARLGLGAPLTWLDGRETTARDLILEELLDLARAGLERLGIDPGDVDRYLGIVQLRVEARRTGADWLLRSLAALGEGDRSETLQTLTAELSRRQRENRPVHEWGWAERPRFQGEALVQRRVEAYMTTDLVTVREDDPVDLAAHLMQWRRIRHIPVEDEEHRLVGLLTRATLLRLLSGGAEGRDPRRLPVGEVMERELVTIGPDTPTHEAIRTLREQGISALPVVREGRLVGLVTERDFLDLTARLLEERAGEA